MNGLFITRLALTFLSHFLSASLLLAIYVPVCLFLCGHAHLLQQTQASTPRPSEMSLQPPSHPVPPIPVSSPPMLLVQAHHTSQSSSVQSHIFTLPSLCTGCSFCLEHHVSSSASPHPWDFCFSLNPTPRTPSFILTPRQEQSPGLSDGC